jgi:predicted PurR-regulated permease PerM
MSDSSPPDHSRGALRFRQAFLLLLVAGISLLFILVIRRFLLAVLLAAVLAGLAYPLYRRLLRRVRGRRALASVATILVLLLGVALPLAGFLAMVAAEAVQVSQEAGGWFQEQRGRLDDLRRLVERVPFAARLMPEPGELAEQFRDAAGTAGGALMGTVAAATRGTMGFFLQLFVMLYAMFFFLMDGPAILRQILYYIPLDPAEEEALLERFVSVTRATLKGSLLIGAIQGAAAGLAFWAAGVPGAALVWVPAVVYLFLVGKVVAGIALLVWCALVVSTIDNFLRPRLVGRDARMSDLLILLSTLGGIFVFGAVGFIVGPIVAALFVSIWHIYGETFRDWLPAVPARLRVAPPTQPVEEQRQPDETASSPP